MTQPGSVQMQSLDENGTLAGSTSDEPFASLNPLSKRGKSGTLAAASAVSHSRVAARGRESPDAVEMQLSVGRVAAASAQLADDDFSDFVGAEDAPGTAARMWCASLSNC